MKFLKHGFKMSLLHPLKIQYMNMNTDNTHTTFLFNRRWQFLVYLNHIKMIILLLQILTAISIPQ